MSLTVSPNPAAVGGSVKITWSASNAKRVRLGWPCGAEYVPVSGTSGSFSRPAKCAGTARISLQSNTLRTISWVDLKVAEAVPVPPPAGLVIVGYGAGTTGGAGGKLSTVSTWAALKAALLASGKRIIKFTSNAGTLDGGGDEINITAGDLTIDGSDSNVILKNYKIIVRTSNVIITEMAMRTGEGSDAAASSDRRAITFNPQTGGTIRQILLDHCSFAWGPDVVCSILNDVADVTAQYCIFGPSLYNSNNPTAPNGYGPNITDSSGGSGATARITYYRNLMIMNHQRNFRAFRTDGWDVVNNVVYDWGGGPAGQGNPKGANLVGNMLKRGPETGSSSTGWDSYLGGSNVQTYFSNSVYFPTSGADRNIGFTTSGALFTPSATFATGTQRSTVYDGGPQALSHGSLTVVTPDATLFEQVVSAAGRTYQDATDILIKNHARNGTSDGNYNGAGFSAPHPFF